MEEWIYDDDLEVPSFGQKKRRRSVYYHLTAVYYHKLHVYESEQGVLQTVQRHLVGKSSVQSGGKFLLSFVDTVSTKTCIPLFEGAALIKGDIN